MKCKNCRYRNKRNFENTILHTCNVAFYLIQKLKQDNKNVWTTDALMCPEDNCIFEKVFKEHKKND